MRLSSIVLPAFFVLLEMYPILLQSYISPTKDLVCITLISIPASHGNLDGFGHGQSNPTYLLEVSSAHGSQPARFVLRKKPPGHLLKSAHAVEREFQVLAALGSPDAGAAVLVPAVHALCTDPSVIGTPFYIMDFVPGRIFTDPCLPDLPPAVRTQIYTAMAGTLAALHSARLPQLQKDGFGRPDSYCRRQVERWAKQYEASVKSIGEEFREEDVKMRGLIAWLRANVRGEDAAAEGVMRGVVHGDFRLDNLVFHPTVVRMRGLIAWLRANVRGEDAAAEGGEAKQYEASVKSIGEEFREEDERMRGLVAWLRANVRGEDAAAEGVMRGVVHGDFRLDNLVFHPIEVRMRGLIAWLRANVRGEDAAAEGVMRGVYEASVKSIGEEFREEDERMRGLVAWLRANVRGEDAAAEGVMRGVVHGDFRLDNLVFHPIEVRMRGLIAWLRANVRGEDAAAEGVMRGVVHGDFRLDNLVFHPTEPRVVAVLDWELSTLGNQMSDVAYCCLPYHLPPSQPGAMLPSLGITQLPGGPAAGPLPAGIPSEAQFVRTYCHEIQRLQGVSLWPVDTWRFYVALSLFRGAAIFTGIYQRALQVVQNERYCNEWLRFSHIDRIAALHGHESPFGPPCSSLPSSSFLTSLLPYTVLPSFPLRAMHHPAGQASPRAEALRRRVAEFVTQEVLPIEGILEEHAVGEARWTIHPLVEHLKEKAKQAGLWNLWIPALRPMQWGTVDDSPPGGAIEGEGKQAGLWNLWIPALDAGVPVAPVLRECQSRGLLGVGLSNLDHAHAISHRPQASPPFPPLSLSPLSGCRCACNGCPARVPEPGAAGGGAVESGPCARHFPPSPSFSAISPPFPLPSLRMQDAGVPVTPVLHECQSRGLLGAGLSNLDYAHVCKEMGKSVWAPELFNCSAPDTGNMEVWINGIRLLRARLSNLDYAHVCKEMGKSVWAPELFNCSAPDTGNMEVLLRYGNEQQQREWLVPLLEGKIRSCFAMTEPRVASSDATNIEARIESAEDHYILHAHKWWASGASDPRCQLAIFMGKHPERAASSGPHSAPAHRQQSMLLVPMNAPGVTVVRPLLVFGYDDAPHGHSEVLFEGVKVPKANVLLGEGRGFEIAQGRLGPGRLHHCMRLIGATERAMDCMLQRALSRVAFGRPLGGNESVVRDTAECRITLEAARLLVLQAAAELDAKGNKEARIAIAMAKVAAPRAAQKVLDRAIQVHGGGGVSSDFPLARLWTAARTLRIADGPDEVHLASIGKKELRDWQKKMMGGARSGRSGKSGGSARL
ncbi:unnamed protein product [Closterium sp. Yama58-4]|nr:unnamed protein product [Closterium sp. Yama58-4]